MLEDFVHSREKWAAEGQGRGEGEKGRRAPAVVEDGSRSQYKWAAEGQWAEGRGRGRDPARPLWMRT